jgi:hypothetical protein
MEGTSCKSAHLDLVVFEQNEQTSSNDSSHIFIHGFHSKPISTNVAAAIPFSLQPKQFNAIKLAKVWW